MAWGQRRQIEHHDWYWTASEDDRREYDAFGPWIYDIKSERDVPRRFRANYAEHRDARFLLKVPRDIERREAHPGMDFYSTVLAVGDAGVSLMRAEPDAVTTQTLSWDQIAAVKSYTNLLISRWTLFLHDGTSFTLDYNTVSSDLMDKVTLFVRSRWQRPSDAQSGTGPDVVTVNDHFFRYELADNRRNGPRPVVPIHFEPRDRWCRDERNRRRLTTGVMMLDAPDELIIVNRDKPTRRFWETRYAASVLFVPYAGLTSFALSPPPTDQPGHFHDLVLRLDKQLIRQSCLVAPDMVLRQLVAHGVPEDTGQAEGPAIGADPMPGA